MDFDVSGLGRWTEPTEFLVDRDQVTAYAAATNDTISAHVEGRLAPPVFAVLPIWESMTQAAGRVVHDEHKIKVLHGEQDISIIRPIAPGQVLRSRARPIGIAGKPSGTTVTVETETADADGPVNTQYVTLFYRGVTGQADAGRCAPSLALASAPSDGAEEQTAEVPTDEDQTYRYSKASGDFMPIHIDAEVARSVGLPGIILHGLCTMAMTSTSVIATLCGGDPERLARLAVRFAAPVFPGQRLVTRFTHGKAGGPHETCSFSTSADGAVVLKSGLAAIRKASR